MRKVLIVASGERAEMEEQQAVDAIAAGHAVPDIGEWQAPAPAIEVPAEAPPAA